VSGRGPPEPRTADDVTVRVEHGLPSFGTRVEHKSELPVSLGARDLVREPDERSEQRRVGGCELRDVGVVLPGHDQHVQWGLRMQVPEGDRIGVLGDDVGRDLPGDDPAEQTLRGDRHAVQASPGVGCCPGRSDQG